MNRVTAIFSAMALCGLIGCSTTVTNSNHNNTGGTTVTAKKHGTISNDTVWNTSVTIDGNLEIKANVTWARKINVTIDANALVSIDSGGSLTILEGDTILSGTGASVEVGYSGSGTLKAQGSDSLPVLFTKAAGVTNWGSTYTGGIEFEKLATTSSLLDHCIIEYATTGVYGYGVPLQITHCTIRHNQANGIYFDETSGPKDSASFIKDTISNNGSYPISMYAEAVGGLTGETYFQNNGKNMIQVFGGDVTKTATWKKHSIPYFISGGIELGDPLVPTLTINPGAVLEFDADAYIDIGYSDNATFIANGTAQDSIRFTNATTGASWGYSGSETGGLVFYGYTTPISSVTYCVIKNATGGIYVTGASLIISNNTIDSNQASGIIFASSNASPKDSSSFLNNTITANGNYGIEIYASQLGNLSGTGTVAGNTKGGVSVTGSDVTKNAVWKKLDTPYFVNGEINIDDATAPTVTIRPGAKFLFATASYINIGYSSGGTLIANGTTTDSISFNSIANGIYWGNTGNEAGGFVFWGSTGVLSSLTYCHIESATWGLYDDGPVGVTHCLFKNCQEYGVVFESYGAPSKISQNTFINSGTADTASNL